MKVIFNKKNIATQSPPTPLSQNHTLTAASIILQRKKKKKKMAIESTLTSSHLSKFPKPVPKTLEIAVPT